MSSEGHPKAEILRATRDHVSKKSEIIAEGARRDAPSTSRWHRLEDPFDTLKARQFPATTRNITLVFLARLCHEVFHLTTLKEA